jgi:hypothetical protein
VYVHRREGEEGREGRGGGGKEGDVGGVVDRQYQNIIIISGTGLGGRYPAPIGGGSQQELGLFRD